MASHIGLNIVVQQLLPYSGLSSTDTVFFIAATNFLRQLHTRGFPIAILRACTRTFYSHHAHLPLYTRWAHSVHTTLLTDVDNRIQRLRRHVPALPATPPRSATSAGPRRVRARAY
jgi:hypothetical protein